MKNLKLHLPVIIFILFEIAVGILLFIEPEKFTRTVIICFGILTLINCLIFLVRYLVAKKRGGDPSSFNIVISVVSLIVGLICVAFTDWIMGLFAVIAMIYGIFLIVSGVYKFKAYSDVRNAGMRGSFLMVATAVLSIILGTVVVLHPFAAQLTMWRFTGAALVGEGLFDLIALIMTMRSSAIIEVEARPKGGE